MSTGAPIRKSPTLRFGCYAVVERHENEMFTWVSTHPLKSEARAAVKRSSQLVVYAWIEAERPLPKAVKP